ncbi:hypothetical protein DRD79_24440 [Salmonella enterica subsp. enterica]|nr:hypothetical protein [Salmonella enterica subsp. enterica serovar Corvallis]
MDFYNHEFYKNNKIIRDKIEQYFYGSRDYNFKKLKKAEKDFFNSVLIEFIDECKREREEEGTKNFKESVRMVLNNHRIKEKGLKNDSFYFMTQSEIKNKPKKWHYDVILKSALSISTWETSGVWCDYDIVYVRSNDHGE